MTKIIGIGDLATIVGEVGLTALLDEVIGELRTSLEAYDPELVQTHDRTGFHYEKPGHGLVEWMPAMDLGRRVAIKTVAYHPTNPAQRGSPSVLATTSVYDTTDGRLLLVCEATALTALRTGAASAVATDVLAVPDASVLGIVGCGAQAVTQVHAVSRVRPIRRIIAFDTAPAVASSLPGRLGGLGLDHIEIEVVGDGDLGRLMATSDVVCTATTVDPGQGPVIPESEHQPWLHINAVGADFPGKLEIPASYLLDALVCPDVPAQCLAEGEAQQIDAGELGPDLPTLVRNADEYRRYRQMLTVFDSTGWALEDLVVAEVIGHHGNRLGVGVDADLQPGATDPYDPYASITAVPVDQEGVNPR